MEADLQRKHLSPSVLLSAKLPVEDELLAKAEALQVLGDDLQHPRLVGRIKATDLYLERVWRGMEGANGLGQLNAAVMVIEGHGKLVRPVPAKLAQVAGGIRRSEVGFSNRHSFGNLTR